jgi:hypothetical protein
MTVGRRAVRPQCLRARSSHLTFTQKSVIRGTPADRNGGQGKSVLGESARPPFLVEVPQPRRTRAPEITRVDIGWVKIEFQGPEYGTPTRSRHAGRCIVASVRTAGSSARLQWSRLCSRRTIGSRTRS